MLTDSPSMFSDRRKRADRRTQNISMPSALDRRATGRRNKFFRPQAWWLQIDYASELVCEKPTEEDAKSDLKHTKKGPLLENLE